MVVASASSARTRATLAVMLLTLLLTSADLGR